MKQKELEIQIQHANDRIEERQKNIDSELLKLDENIKKYTSWAWSLVWVGILVSISSIIYFVFKNNEGGFALNLLGDFLGGSVASLWSLAGLLFIYVAFLGQKQQLLNQQLEIMYNQLEVKYTRLELAGQKQEMKEQNLTLRQQKFENTFFQLINLFSSILNALDLRNQHGTVTTSGRDCFKVFFNRFKGILRGIVQDTSLSRRNQSSASVSEAIGAYNELYTNEKADLSHYFRTIYHIYKFIDTSEIEHKQQYASFARAQLSSYEQVLLFYNCLHKNGVDKFKPLLEKYSVFKNLDVSLVFNKEHLKAYKPSAYGK